MSSSSAIDATPDHVGRSNAYLVGLALPVALFLAQVIYLWGFTIDDIAITYRYALHLANGQGLVWNPGGMHVEGFSNFLWVLILAAVGRIGLDIVTAAAVLGALFGLISLVLLFYLCRRLWAPAQFWWSPVLMVALTPEWTMWAVSGLEIPLYCALLILALLGLTGRNRARLWLLMIALPCLVLIRPEGMIMAGLMLTGGILAESGSKRERLKPYVAPIVTVLTTAAALLIFRLLYFGSPLPNTVYAKFSGSLSSLRQVADWLIFGIPFFPSWLVCVRSIKTQNYRFVLLAALFMVIAQMAIVLPVLPVMYFLHRYQIAFLPFLVLAVPSLIALVPQSRRWISTTILVLMTAWTVKEWPQVSLWVGSERYWRQTRQDVAQQLMQLPSDTRLALIDAGYIPYLCDLPTLDVWGLCDRRTAHRGFSAEATLEEEPGVYVMSVHVTDDGKLSMLQGRDRLVAKTTRFQNRYTAWKVCGHARELGQIAFDGYAIFLDTASARGRTADPQTKP